jgi:hypothetical protein
MIPHPIADLMVKFWLHNQDTEALCVHGSADVSAAD